MINIKNTIALLVFALYITSNIYAQKELKYAPHKFLPVAISAPIPAYPPKAIAAKAKGSVRVDIKIDETGKVIEASFVSGHRLLRNSVLNAAMRWKFNQITEDAGLRRARLTFTYYLNNDKYVEPNLDEVRYKYRVKIYRVAEPDCFNNCI